MPTAGLLRYQDRFREVATVHEYDHEVYAPGAYDDFIWSLQKPWLGEVVREASRTPHPARYLDFACGTGRVLSFAEPQVQQAFGLDISREMARVASTRAPGAQVVVGDLLRQHDLVGGHFDLITAFRYLLNADAELRVPVLRALAERLRDSTSRLVFNVQGHSGSVRHLAVRYHAVRGRTHRELSYPAILEVVDAAGLRVEQVRGFGICPRGLYSTPLGRPARAVDRWAASTRRLWRISVDLVLVCRRKEPAPGSGTVAVPSLQAGAGTEGSAFAPEGSAGSAP